MLRTNKSSGVGMSEIAAAAGVAVGTLYRHFFTRTDLVATVVADSGDKLACVNPMLVGMGFVDRHAY